MDTRRDDRYRFFRHHAGGIVGENARIALDLARTESLLEEAIDLDVASVEWVDDEEPYEHGFLTDAELAAKFASNEWTGPYGCIVRVYDSPASGAVATDAIAQESLWGIVVGPRGTNDPYCRVVAAELASELTDELRQAIGDARDALAEAVS